MAYLAIKKVKGRYYGYVQESYREGGQVRTRTVEYLGAIEPAIAQQVQATRRQLGQADMAALVQSVRDASVTATRAPETSSDARDALQTDQPTTAPQKARYQRLMVNGNSELVDMQTGELIELKHAPVITTDNQPRRPLANALKLPDNLAIHRVNLSALVATHRRFGARLHRLKINPATMPDVTIAYGHPDGLKRDRQGNYTVTVSRRNRKVRDTINKRRLWNHTRQAISHAMLDAIEAERPDLFAELHSELDARHREAKRWVFECIAQTQIPAMRLALSLQFLLWNKIPRDVRGKADPADLGQVSFDTVNDWRGETALILAEAQKSGWQALEQRHANTRRKLKARITRRKNDLSEMTALERLSATLSGKRRRILREVITTETQLRAHDNLTKRTALIRDLLDPPPRQKPAKAINATRSKLRRATGENLPDRARTASRDHDTSGLVWNVKKPLPNGQGVEHRIYDQSGTELEGKRHIDKPKS